MIVLWRIFPDTNNRGLGITVRSPDDTVPLPVLLPVAVPVGVKRFF